MSAYQFLQLEHHDTGCATIWLNRPQRHNALHAGLIAELQRAVDELSQQPAVRAVVLAGRGPSFCAGGDLEWMREQASAPYELNLEDARQLARTLRTLALCPKPTIARVHGAALGGGVGLVAACDLAISSRDAVFGTTETRLGLTPSTIALYVSEAIGERAARYCFLTGTRFDAAEARRLGLVQEVVEPDALEGAVNATLAAICLGAPQAQAHCKWLLAELRGRDPALETTIDESARSLASVRAGEEAREGIEAFFARRKPSWQA
jgi:methylglutaconyl-CoA hydratase